MSKYPVWDEAESKYVYELDLEDVIGYKPDFISNQENIPLPTFKDNSIVFKARKDHPNFDQSGQWREYLHYSVATNTKRRQPICVALNVDLNLRYTKLKSVEGYNDNWKIDKAIGADNQLGDDYYSKSGWDKNSDWDKGHMARRSTSAWGVDKAAAIRANNDTYYYTNCCLQHENLNRDEWKEVEDGVEDLQSKSTGKVVVFIGPIYDFGVKIFDREKKEIQVSDPDGSGGQEPAEIPDAFFKIFSFVGNKSEKLETRAHIYKQNETIVKNQRGSRDTEPEHFQATIEEIENATGLYFGDENSVLKKSLVLDEMVSIAEAYINASENDRKESEYEWIDLTNASQNYNVDLSEWKISTQNGAAYTFPKGTIIEAGLRYRVSKLNDKGMALTNRSGSLELKNSKGVQVDKVRWTNAKNGETTSNFIRD